MEDLLDLKLMREGIFSLRPVPFDPKETFELVKDIFDPQVKAKKIGIKVSIGENLRLPQDMDHYFGTVEEGKQRDFIPRRNTRSLAYIPQLYGDGRRFKQVLINLVKNALKFTNTGQIDIKACYRPEPENLLVVHVEDTGVGIENQDLPRLFS